MMNLRLAMVQMNAVVGDLEGNTKEICRWIREAKKAKADVVVFPELAVSGYPPEDLLLMSQFLRDVHRMQTQIAKASSGLMVVVGSVDRPRDVKLKTHPPSNGYDPSDRQKPLNVAWVFAKGRLVLSYAKHKLPNYGVFDEQRYFQEGSANPIVCLGSARIGINICEDIWFANGPVCSQVKYGGAHLIVNINASPYHVGKTRERRRMLVERAREHGVWVSYTNMVGGQDELVFDGNSLVIDPRGTLVAQAKAFEEDLLLTDLSLSRATNHRSKRVSTVSPSQKRVGISFIPIPWQPSPSQTVSPSVKRGRSSMTEGEEVYRALVLGVRDYVRKNGFSKVVVGISGGIDSALTALIARDALGASQVVGVMMPSPYTSSASKQDSRALAKNLGMDLLNLPISGLFKTFLRELRPLFKGCPVDTTEENLQARIRGMLLMALSNKFGYLVLTTGNKSEMSVGYATLYGDMAGGFAVIKDVPKTRVYQIARWRSDYQGPDFDPVSIPERIHSRAPSAELKANQTDQDSLPPYTELDAILQAYVEHNQSRKAIAKSGYPVHIVQKVLQLVDQSEYKRRQAPIGIKITARALGKDRRMPITNRYLPKR
ncbi:MAG: NAD+ synthase [Nitrospirota bacterium]|nr:NAD+ synthase [Nitrospirota bacterium]MDH5586292.1 NAD+ synthase [Nitrospirota bacterium]MDH5773742.1 NAD+ synthase [Nitrospirota bacterium]